MPARDEFVFGHGWQADTLVMWGNRCLGDRSAENEDLRTGQAEAPADGRLRVPVNRQLGIGQFTIVKSQSLRSGHQQAAVHQCRQSARNGPSTEQSKWLLETFADSPSAWRLGADCDTRSDSGPHLLVDRQCNPLGDFKRNAKRKFDGAVEAAGIGKAVHPNHQTLSRYDRHRTFTLKDFVLQGSKLELAPFAFRSLQTQGLCGHVHPQPGSPVLGMPCICGREP